ncbi:MAG: hypothetical protein V3S39_09875 [Thermodesulfobacteriota bacterium]
MADNCEKLLADPALHQQFKAAARGPALIKYDSGIIVSLYENVIKQCSLREWARTGPSPRRASPLSHHPRCSLNLPGHCAKNC